MAPWAPENREGSPRFRQVGDRSPVASFSVKNCSGVLAASLPRTCADLAGCRVYQLVMPTLSLPNSADYKFTHKDYWKQNLEQNCSGDSEGWGEKLKNGACQIVFATLLLSRGFGKEGNLWKWIARLGGWHWWEKCSILGHGPGDWKDRLLW